MYPEADRRQVAGNVQKRIQEFASKADQTKIMANLKRFRGAALATTGLTFVTVASGAFVAGNSAGNAYNDWPLMNGQILPWIDVMEDHPHEGPFYRKFFENTALVQFDHRMLAYLTSGAVAGTVYTGLSMNSGAIGQTLKLLTPQAMTALKATGAIAVAQVSLGISTLVMNVPIHLAATHQLGR
jgi:cytochrome c oxidase assembly protein subunit 15